MDSAEQKLFREDNTRWLGGEKISQLKFLHNSLAEATLPDGTKRRGWIVAAWIPDSEPMYTVECEDGSDDIQCAESSLNVVNDD